jgi:hypothetical protein
MNRATLIAWVGLAAVSLAGCDGVTKSGTPAGEPRPTAFQTATVIPKAPAGWEGPQLTVAQTHEDIEEIIDGEAHQYYAYDLISLTRAVYRGPGESQATIDVYHMPTAADAFGVYSLWRAGAAAVLPIGDEGTQSQGEVRFYKGALYVHVSVDESAPEAPSIARNLAQRIATLAPPQEVNLPDMARLPAQDRLPNSLVYVKRNYRSQEFLRNAVSARYQGTNKRPYQLFICSYPSAGGAGEAFKRLIETATYPKATGTGWITYTDEFDGEVMVFHRGSHLVGATNGQKEKARAVADKLEP